MRRAKSLVFAGLWAASSALASTYYALEVRGGSKVFSVDRPILKGRVYLFHRYPDGVFMSLAASEVDGVLSLDEPAPSEKLAPGQAVYVGGVMPGSAFAAAAAQVPAVAPPGPDAGDMDSGYGYYGSYWGGGGYFPPPRPPAPAPPSRIGPNGYPILAPPGSPGSTPSPIGPNGFPVLAPARPAPRPH
jgi:hypothetical protein